jgi:hypothetical protein
MSFRLSALWTRHTDTTRLAPRPPSGITYFRPVLEGFEDRVVPDHGIGGAIAAQVAPGAIANNIEITGVDLTNLQIVDNVLTASGTVTGQLAGLPFTTDITNFALQLVPDDPSTRATECSVLNLELAPINLSLLGLHVDTSPICLEANAFEGRGLLGDLLCGLAGGGVLPTTNQLNRLEGGLVDLLDGVLNRSPATASTAAESVCTGECEVLELAVGPLDLRLLGLQVALDNCEDGPVQVCVSATASEGLLGNLLCSLAGGDEPLGLSLGEITRLLNRAEALLEDGTLSVRDAGRLLNMLGRFII